MAMTQQSSKENPHPALALLTSAAPDLGTRVKVDGVRRDDLPVKPCAVDDQGRVWRLEQGTDGDYLVFVGSLVR